MGTVGNDDGDDGIYREPTTVVAVAVAAAMRSWWGDAVRFVRRCGRPETVALVRDTVGTVTVALMAATVTAMVGTVVAGTVGL